MVAQPDWLSRAAALPESDRAKALEPIATPNTAVDPLAARAIGRMLAALDELETARQVVGDGFSPEAEATLRRACGHVEAAATELCTYAASARGAGR